MFLSRQTLSSLHELANSIGHVRLMSNFVVTKNKDHFKIEHEGRAGEFHFQWLRDHCRHPSVYNHDTHQRSISLLEFSSQVEPVSYQIKEDKFLDIKWNDNHDSQFALDWLVREFACSDRRAVFKQKVKRRIWEGATFPMEAATTDYQSFMDEDAGLAKVIRSILENGFAMVKGAEHNVDGTRATVERVAPVCQTIYGSMFVLTTDGLKNVSDSSYSTVALGPHTDTTYYQEALGLQVFHCTQPADVGGENILVDGFNVAEIIREKHPETYKFFSEFPIEAEYIHDDPDDHFLNLDFVFKHHPVTKELQQFRFNIYDRAVHRMTLSEQRSFYKHYRTLAEVGNDPANAFWLGLEPGTVLFIDNWRVMHGRASFQGKRTMTGCYVGRTEFMSRANIKNMS